jgi:catechol 2,3-dioxygenase-like lactoylglutathione lyase family enzyme
MARDLFAGVGVSDYPHALTWYEALLGAPPSFRPHDTEAVWELAENRYLYVVRKPEQAGHGMVMLFVDDLDAHVAHIAARGIEPVEQATHDGGVRKVTFRDADGNEISFGGAPPGG